MSVESQIDGEIAVKLRLLIGQCRNAILDECALAALASGFVMGGYEYGLGRGYERKNHTLLTITN